MSYSIEEDIELKMVGLELMFLTPEKYSNTEGITAVELAKLVNIPVEIVKKKLQILKDKDIVKLDIESPNGRSLTFGDVIVRVSASYATAAHIDTDEANALCPGKECYGEMIK